MGICKDRATTYLKRLGYNAVRHPQAGIHPLQLIGQQRGGVALLGPLDRLITNPPGPLPKITTDQRAADLSGQSSSTLSLAIGLNVLGNFIGAMGGNLGLKSEYKQAHSIQFEFHDVLVDSVVPLEVGDYLRLGEVDEGNLVLEQYVLGNGNLYLITKTVKTSQFTVKAFSQDGQALEVDIPVIEQVVGGDIKVKSESSQSSTVTYEGPEYLVFGFQAFVVGVYDGYLTVVSAEPGSVAMEYASTGDVVQGEPAMLADGALVNLVPEAMLAN